MPPLPLQKGSGASFLSGSPLSLAPCMLWGPPTTHHRGGAWLGRGPLLTQEAVAPPICGVWVGYLAASNPPEMRQVLIVMRESASCHLCSSGVSGDGPQLASLPSSRSLLGLVPFSRGLQGPLGKCLLSSSPSPTLHPRNEA